MGLCQSKQVKPKQKSKASKTVRICKRKDNSFNENKLRQTLDEIFQKYDKDGSGDLTKDEVILMLKEMMGKKGSQISDADMKIMIDNMFDKADRDNNGQLEREEFYKFYKMI